MGEAPGTMTFDDETNGGNELEEARAAGDSEVRDALG